MLLSKRFDGTLTVRTANFGGARENLCQPTGSTEITLPTVRRIG